MENDEAFIMKALKLKKEAERRITEILTELEKETMMDVSEVNFSKKAISSTTGVILHTYHTDIEMKL